MNIKEKVEKFYYETKRVDRNNIESYLNIYQKNNGRLEGGRQYDPKYNDENAKYQIYTLGCSWTYGWYVEQEQTFTHLLGDEIQQFIITEQVEQV